MKTALAKHFKKTITQPFIYSVKKSANPGKAKEGFAHNNCFMKTDFSAQIYPWKCKDLKNKNISAYILKL